MVVSVTMTAMVVMKMMIVSGYNDDEDGDAV